MSDATESRSLEKLASDQEKIGTNVVATAGMDSSALYMSLLTTHSDVGMDLLADIAQHPAFRSRGR